MVRPDQTHGDVRDACDDGEHVLARAGPGIYVCRHCGLDSSSIVDWLDHDTK